MTSVKVKFRPSNHECREGVVYYQIIKSRVIRQLKTDYRLFAYEWNENGETVIICDSNRANYLHSIGERIKWDVKRLKAIIGRLDNKRNQYTYH